MFCLVVWFGCPIVYSEVLLVSWCLHERQYFFIRQLLISHNLPLSNWIIRDKQGKKWITGLLYFDKHFIKFR